MTSEVYDKLVLSNQPHDFFNKNWSSYYPTNYGDTFLPNAKKTHRDGLKTYDGIGLLEGITHNDINFKTPNDNESLIIVTHLFAYPLGVPATYIKEKILLPRNGICVFAELSDAGSENIDIVIYLGGRVRNYINQYSKETIKKDFLHSNTTLQEFKNYFSKGISNRSIIAYLFSNLDINVSSPPKAMVSFYRSPEHALGEYGKGDSTYMGTFGFDKFDEDVIGDGLYHKYKTLDTVKPRKNTLEYSKVKEATYFCPYLSLWPPNVEGNMRMEQKVRLASM